MNAVLKPHSQTTTPPANPTKTTPLCVRVWVSVGVANANATEEPTLRKKSSESTATVTTILAKESTVSCALSEARVSVGAFATARQAGRVMPVNALIVPPCALNPTATT